MKKNIIIAIALILLSGLSGYIIGSKIYNCGYFPDNIPEIIENRQNYGRFTNPLLECDLNYMSTHSTLIELEDELLNYIYRQKENDHHVHVSLYLRVLNNGEWIGINENEIYSPASLLKVPVLIAVLKKAETDAQFLSRKVDYKELQEDLFTPNIKDSSLQLGRSYTLEELARRMIVYSDNEAKSLLARVLGEEFLYKVSSDLGVNLRGMDFTKDNLSVKKYSNFFRILYNATYLSKEMSEKALEIMSQSSFKKGIRAGLPDNIIVSNKFGERTFSDSQIRQLHDCGIVYLPGSPYLLCIMTRGSDIEQQSKIISQLSSIIYHKMSARNIF
jgi:beta-lactamase class A